MERVSLASFLKKEKEELKGKVFCFPTDTVYGLAALYGDEDGIGKIYKIKNRDPNKPLANLCSNLNQILALGIEISDEAQEMMEKYWPGPLTIILQKENEKISFRMPDSEIALKILDRFSLLTTTSVNESGEKELNDLDAIEEKFASTIDYLITDQAQLSKIPSTVVELDNGSIKIIRKGTINLE